MQLDLRFGDCLEILPQIPDNSVDVICCDPPYGTTACAYDSIIPLDPLWAQYKRIIKGKGAILIFGAQPFSSAVVASNFEMFRYEWIWEKQKPTNFLKARFMPLRAHEQILVFSKGQTPYFPQGLTEVNIKSGRKNKIARGVYESRESHKEDYVQTQGNFPRSILKFSTDTTNPHPAAKPVELLKYLVKTYSEPGDVVLDNCMGGGTCGVACVETGRGFIGCENDEDYFAIAQERIQRAVDRRDGKGIKTQPFAATTGLFAAQ